MVGSLEPMMKYQKHHRQTRCREAAPILFRLVRILEVPQRNQYPTARLGQLVTLGNLVLHLSRCLLEVRTNSE